MHTIWRHWGKAAMKKCPVCKAEIEDNARFCLYCMTSLDEKQAVKKQKEKGRMRTAIIAALLVLVLATGSVWFVLRRNLASVTAGQNSSASIGVSASQDTDSPSADMSRSRGTEASSSMSDGADIGGEDPQSEDPTGSGSVSDTDSLASAPNTGSQTADSSTASSAAQAPVSSVTYVYRQAQKGDDYLSWLPIDENDIVITGVSTVSESGEYVIPETIDGKTVIAIMGNAFNDEQIRDTVKKVVVPANVKSIWDHAFSMCYNLTDIYFCGNAVYTSPYAFALASRRTGTLTIYCSADCTDRNFRYYKNCADGSYDAVYEEWNG